MIEDAEFLEHIVSGELHGEVTGEAIRRLYDASSRRSTPAAAAFP